MYKAIKEIGGYKIGEEVPTYKAMAWKDMYAVPHIEEVVSKTTVKPIVKEKPAIIKIKSTEVKKKKVRY